MNPLRLVLSVSIVAVASGALAAQERRLPLDTAHGLALHHAEATPATFKGRAALRLTAPPAAPGSAPGAAAAKKKGAGKKGGGGEAARTDHLAIVEGLEFADGTIEVDIAGEPGAGAAGGARGFVGIAFRVGADRRTYDCFYLRPTNGRAEDQERRNHTAQYVSHPAHTWFALREATPSRYESYVDIQPAEWIRVKIVVAGDKARLFVNNAEQPTLIVNDVKTGATGKGAVALWFEGSTVAHFANLRVIPAR
ncbi:MAG: hypothetical protein JNL39_06495 [Opitutaceae bacterium]|nr:hypothetical protein [Opitutaceae bacterium]